MIVRPTSSGADQEMDWVQKTFIEFVHLTHNTTWCALTFACYQEVRVVRGWLSQLLRVRCRCGVPRLVLLCLLLVIRFQPLLDCLLCLLINRSRDQIAIFSGCRATLLIGLLDCIIASILECLMFNFYLLQFFSVPAFQKSSIS